MGEEEEIKDNDAGVAELILNALKTKPNTIGQVDALTGKQSTFQQMRENSVKCALWLKKQGVQSGDVILISIPNHMDAYIPFLACLYIGALPNPFNANPSITNLKRIVQLTESKVIFVSSKTSKMLCQLTGLKHIYSKVVIFGEVEHRNETEEDATVFVTLESILDGEFDETEITEFSCTKSKKLRDTIMILYSSGSTGLFKGVEIPGMLILSPGSKQTFLLLPGDVVLWMGGLNWITGMALTILSILSYATAIKITGCNNEQLCQTIEKYKVYRGIIESQESDSVTDKFTLVIKRDTRSEEMRYLLID